MAKAPGKKVAATKKKTANKSADAGTKALASKTQAKKILSEK